MLSRKQRLLLSFPVLLLTLSLAACNPGPDVPPPADTDAIDPNSKLGLPKPIGIEPVLQPETRVLSNAEAGKITNLNMLNAPECLTNTETRPVCQFALTLNPVPADVKVGSVLVAGVTPVTPDGLLVKVTSLQGTTIQATEARLGDALKEGEFQGERDLTPAQIRTQWLRPGMQPSSKLRAQGNEFGRAFDYTLNHVKLEEGVYADGSVAFDVGCGAYGGLTWKTVWGVPIYPNGVKFEAKCGVQQNAALNITSETVISLNKEYELAQYTMEPITFFVGPVPVVLVPKVILTVNASGKVSASMNFGVTEHFNAVAGIYYKKGFQTIKDFSRGFDTHVGALAGPVDATAGLNLREELLLYGIVGPSMSESAYLNFKGAPGTKPLWCLKGGLKAGVGLHIDLGIKTLNWGPAEIFNESTQIGCAANTPPSVQITLPGNGATFYKGVTSFGGFQATTSDAEDGPLPVTWQSNLDGPLGSSPSGQPLFPNLKTIGTHTITATTTDHDGAQGSASIQVTLKNPAPTVTLTVTDANNNPITYISGRGYMGQQGESVYATAKIEYPSMLPLPCSALTWNGGGLPVTSGGSCQARIDLTQQGTFTVTATATDTQGNAGSSSFRMYVTEPPVVVTPQFSAVTAKNLSFNPPVPVLNNSTVIAGSEVQLDVTYLNQPQAQKNVRFDWTYKLDTETNWTPLPASTTADTATTSTRSYKTFQYKNDKKYTFRVQMIDQATNAVLDTRTITVTWQGAPA